MNPLPMHDAEHESHPHQHSEDHHPHEYKHGRFDGLREMIPFLHSHRHGDVNVDTALETSERGIWALKISLLALGATALFQVFIVQTSGSVSLLADTIHNFSDALTAVPLWVAFVLGRRAASRRFTYGYGRAEDVAGVVIVAMISASALLAGYESYQKFVHPQPLDNVGGLLQRQSLVFLETKRLLFFAFGLGVKLAQQRWSLMDYTRGLMG